VPARLRLAVAVEPVVGDHAARDDDGGPADERYGGREARAKGRPSRLVPTLAIALDAPVKEPDIDGGDDHEGDFEAKP
jgi:hypothetical protein